MLEPITLLATILICVSAYADNFAPPSWAGRPLSYHAEWAFGSSGDLSNPDSESGGGPVNSEFLYDQFSTHIDYDGPGWVWDVADGDGGITKPSGGSFGINTINWVDELPLKYVRVQLTYTGPAPDVPHAQGYSFDLYHGGGGATTTDHGLFASDPPVFVDANHAYWDITMIPNPDWEQIVVNVPQGTIIDQIVVDTISIPEPSTMTALAMDACFVLRRRR